MMKTKPFKMTALAFAAAQVALLYSGTALAQTDASAPAGTDDGQLSTVVVTGQRKQMETSQKIKQDADQIVDSVVADEAGKLPDKSITEVLQRVVGVTMDRNRSRAGGLSTTGGALGFDVEGSGVQIRGLSWGSSTLNGRESFSAGWPGRELSWGDVPPELMAGVDVYKNPSAELIEGGISGQINLRTRLPFDSKGESGAFSVSDNYSVFGKTNSPALSGLYSNRWNTDFGEFGALVDLSDNKSAYHNDSYSISAYYPFTTVVPGKTVWAPVSASWSTSDGESQRRGLYGALQWKKNDMQSSLTYFDSAFSSTSTGADMHTQSNNAYGTQFTNATFNSAGVFQSGTLSYPTGGAGGNQFAAGGIGMGTDQTYNDAQGRTQELAWNFKWKINDRWSFQNDLQWVHATDHGDGRMLALGTFVPSMNLAMNGSAPPTVTFNAAATQALANPANYYWDFMQPALAQAKADLYAWKTDGKFLFDDAVLRDLRFGMRLTDRTSDRQNSAGSGWQSISDPWNVQPTTVPGQIPAASALGWQWPNFAYMSNPQYAIPGGVQTMQFSNFFNGAAGQPPKIVVPTMAMVMNYPNAYQQLWQVNVNACIAANAYKGTPSAYCATQINTWKQEGFDPNNLNDTSKHNEQTEALYGMLRFGFDDWKYPLEGNAGLRVINTHTIAHGFTVFTPSYNAQTPPSVPQFGAINQPLDVSSTHLDAIPSLNLKLNWSDKLQSRLALSQGISRPDFQQLQEYITLNQNVTMDTTGKNVQSIGYTGSNNGNAELKPIKSDNADLSLEWYPQNGQSLTAVMFYKKVTDIIMTDTYTRTFNDLAGNPQSFLVTGPANAAQLWEGGIEIAGSTYLDKIPGLAEWLPAWTKGFGISSNVTFLTGKQNLYHPYTMPYCPAGGGSTAGNLYGCDTNGLPFKDLPVPYMSKRAFNVGFMYDQGPISARLAYSWRDRTLQATNAYGASGYDATSADPARIVAGVAPHDVGWGLPVWQEAVGQWDGGVSANFDKNMYASFNVSNITSVVTRQTQQQAPGVMGHAWFNPGPSLRLSMGYHF